MLRGRATLAVLALVAVSACQATPPPAPDEAEARAFLDRVVVAAIARDFDALCEMASGTCRQDLDAAGPGTSPTEPPEEVGVRELPSQQLEGGSWLQGGRVFQLCGRDGLDQPYASEVLVFDSGGGELLAVNAVFWTGARITVPGPGAGRPPTPIDCPGSGEGPSPSPCPASFVEGTLEMESSGDIVVVTATGDRVRIKWPGGFWIRETDPPVILDQAGTVVATVGTEVRLPGGENAEGEFQACFG